MNLQNYLNRCSEVIPDYHEILTDLKASPKIIREIEANRFVTTRFHEEK